jgi:hypothetical protein
LRLVLLTVAATLFSICDPDLLRRVDGGGGGDNREEEGGDAAEGGGIRRGVAIFHFMISRFSGCDEMRRVVLK